LVVDEPAGATLIASVLAVPEARVLATLDEIRRDYTRSGRGFELREIAGGWRLYTREEFAPYVERFVLDGQQARLTQAALETLAVVAYRQPVSRARVSAVRGVNVDGVMRTLVSRGLVEEAGAEDSGAVLYRTTDYFMERLGLRSLEELPNLANFLPESTTIEELEGELSSSGRDE
jgi:segregation and condensation protein B